MAARRLRAHRRPDPTRRPGLPARHRRRGQREPPPARGARRLRRDLPCLRRRGLGLRPPGPRGRRRDAMARRRGRLARRARPARPGRPHRDEERRDGRARPTTARCRRARHPPRVVDPRGRRAGRHAAGADDAVVIASVESLLAGTDAHVWLGDGVESPIEDPRVHAGRPGPRCAGPGALARRLRGGAPARHDAARADPRRPGREPSSADLLDPRRQPAESRCSSRCGLGRCLPVCGWSGWSRRRSSSATGSHARRGDGVVDRGLVEVPVKGRSRCPQIPCETGAFRFGEFVLTREDCARGG